ncbi:MAG: hypothetical protein U0805_15225 [Pirellulales bacterium]
MEVVVFPDYDAMSRAAAEEIAALLNAKPNAVLGMATGSTPVGVYKELVRLHKEGRLDFAKSRHSTSMSTWACRRRTRRAFITSCRRTSSGT